MPTGRARWIVGAVSLAWAMLAVGCSSPDAASVAGPAPAPDVTDASGGGTPDAPPTAPDTAASADVEATCIPQCTGRQCGPDGCGGRCGACSDPCTGDKDVPGLCDVSGHCAIPCGQLDVSVLYTGPMVLTELVAYLHPNVPCTGTPLSPAAAELTSAAASSRAEPLVLGPVTGGGPHTVAVRATGPGGVVRDGCTAGVTLTAAHTPVQVVLTDGPAAFYQGTYEILSELQLTGELPPSVGAVVTNLDEMSDDHDLANEDPTNGQYGEDPAAFLLDFVYRQFCCWEATGSDPDWETCTAQAATHPTGDLSAIYLQDFTTWPGAQPRVTGVCGALGLGVNGLLQQQVLDLLESSAPGLATLLATLPVDLAESLRHMTLRSRLTLGKVTETLAATFTHTLLALRVTLHDTQGAPHTVELSLAGEGITALPQQGKATLVEGRLTIPQHGFQLRLGKLLRRIYTEALLPVLGYATTEAMLATWVDCAALGAKAEDLIPDAGFLDASDYEGYCQKGLEAAAKYILDTIEQTADATTALTLEGAAGPGITRTDGRVTTLLDGVWSGSWAEAGQQGQFFGTFATPPPP